MGLVGVSSKALADQYLVEPTDSFKEQEAKSAAFEENRRQIRRKWDDIYYRLVSSEEPKAITDALNKMTEFILKLSDIPAGVKKKDIVKLCRKKKFNGYKILPNWTIEVEDAYERFTKVFDRARLPTSVSTF